MTTQALRNHDKMKDDAIAQLSDQVMALTARMQEFERKQHACCQKELFYNPYECSLNVESR